VVGRGEKRKKKDESKTDGNHTDVRSADHRHGAPKEKGVRTIKKIYTASLRGAHYINSNEMWGADHQ